VSFCGVGARQVFRVERGGVNFLKNMLEIRRRFGIVDLVPKDWIRMVEEVMMEWRGLGLSFRADKHGSLGLSFF